MTHDEGPVPIGLAIVAITALALLLTAAPADAATRVFVAHLVGSQETPPEVTTAAGDAVVILDTTTNLLNWIVTHTVTDPTAAHFHGNGFPGVAASILVPIGGAGTSGSPIVGSTTLSAPQAADLLAGRWYLNVHSTSLPNGEIRGQLAAVRDAPLTIFPATGAGPIVRTAAFDLTLVLQGGATPVSGSVTLNGANVTSAFLACMHVGTRVAGGLTFRCPIPGGLFAPGEDFLSVVLNLSDGSSVGSTATWFIDNNTEP